MFGEIKRLEEELEKTKEELRETMKEPDEYKKRQPETAGVRNGKPFFLHAAGLQSGIIGREPGA